MNLNSAAVIQQLNLALRAGKVEQIKPLLHMLTQLAATDKKLHLALAQAYEALAKPEIAIEHYFYAGNAMLPPSQALAALARAVDLSQQHQLIKHGLPPAKLWATKCPDDTKARHAHGYLLYRAKFLPAAIREFEAVLKIDPKHAWSTNYLGRAYSLMGCDDLAMKYLLASIELEPDNIEFRRQAAYACNCAQDLAPERVLALHKEHAECLLKDLPAPAAAKKSRQPNKVLRIGYLSPDFYWHSVAYFFRALLENRPEGLEIYCYADSSNNDEMTQLLKKRADRWRDVHHMDDEGLAQQIQVDGLDILVDLNGPLGKSRQGVFAQKLAPTQIAYLGYPNTTGLEAIDYRITDAFADPEGADSLYTEKLIRLNPSFLCFSADPAAPEVAPLPALGKDRGITFGSFNTTQKINRAVIAAWSAILIRVPNARMLIKAGPLHDKEYCEWLLAQFGEQGVDAQRIELIGWTPDKRSHLECYARVDIHLDTFPYNGTTTTCEALWQGVPTVCLAGKEHRTRVGLSICNQVELNDWVADTLDAYVALAVAKAQDLAALATLRKNLRQRMADSPLMQAEEFSEAFYGALERVAQASP